MTANIQSAFIYMPCLAMNTNTSTNTNHHGHFFSKIKKKGGLLN